MLHGPYVVINQLIKYIQKVTHLENSFNIHVRGKNISIQQKMTKVGTFENKVQIWSFKSAYLFVG
jgi:hypothetical protein